jgi:hypothetical protein
MQDARSHGRARLLSGPGTWAATVNCRIEVFRYFPTVAQKTSRGSVKARFR